MIPKNRLLLFILVAISIAVIAVGCGKQKEASGVGEKTVEREAEQKPEEDLEISNVTILKYGEGELTNYQVVFWAGNNSDMICKASTLVCTMYDADGKVVSSQEGALGGTLPPGRWVASDPAYNVLAPPVRAEINVRDLEWSAIQANTPNFKKLQADYSAGSYGIGKVVGLFNYQGPELETIKIVAFLLGTNGEPVGVYEGYKDNIISGDNPFELVVGNETGQPISSVELSFIW